MNFQVTAVNGQPVMTWNEATDITTNIWVLTNLRKGSFFLNLSLGNELLNSRKLTDDTVNMAPKWIAAALKPLLQCGRATSIDVTAERDARDRNRLNYQVKATQPDGLIVTYTDWYEVV
jgi:phage gp46-like protein